MQEKIGDFHSLVDGIKDNGSVRKCLSRSKLENIFFSILFLEVSQVHPNSPAFHAGLEKGDFLVTFEDDLVLFMSWQDVEAKMKALQSQHLHLKIERGDVKPMVNPEEEEFLRRQTQTNRKKLNEDGVVTIVLDKDRGIYRKYQ